MSPKKFLIIPYTFAIIKNNSFDKVFMRGDTASLKTIMINCLFLLFKLYNI